MKKSEFNMGITSLALGASLCAALAACGGGGGDDSSASNSAGNAPTVTTSGTAAVGAPIVGGSVSLKCASGATAAAATGSDGSWSVSLKSTDYPCAVRVSDGQANGAALAAPLHSVAAASGTTNITPLTDLEVGVLAKGDTETWFNGAKNGDLSGAITSGNLADALARLTTALSTLPGKPELPDNFNPLTSGFKAEKGDAGDNLLESYGAALTAAGLSQSDAAAKTASGTALTQAAYSATAYTTGASYTTDPVSIQMGSSVNLDGTFGIAIADPNRGQYTAKAKIDADGNVTSFTDAGKFTAIVSLLGNRVGQLCTANGAGGVVAGQPGQYAYVSSDLTEVTDPNELNGQKFLEYEDCTQSGTSVFSNGAVTFTDKDGSPDTPISNIAQAFTADGLADTKNHSVEHAKAYRYTANGVTKYVYITVNSTATPGTNDDPLVFDIDTKYITIGLSQ